MQNAPSKIFAGVLNTPLNYAFSRKLNTCKDHARTLTALSGPLKHLTAGLHYERFLSEILFKELFRATLIMCNAYWNNFKDFHEGPDVNLSTLRISSHDKQFGLATFLSHDDRSLLKISEMLCNKYIILILQRRSPSRNSQKYKFQILYITTEKVKITKPYRQEPILDLWQS